MSNKDEAGGCFVIVVAVTMALSGFAFGTFYGLEWYRSTAIEHNAAEWRVDPKTGEKSFHWLTDKTEE